MPGSETADRHTRNLLWAVRGLCEDYLFDRRVWCGLGEIEDEAGLRNRLESLVDWYYAGPNGRFAEEQTAAVAVELENTYGEDRT
jgi:hypothetical protein